MNRTSMIGALAALTLVAGASAAQTGNRAPTTTTTTHQTPVGPVTHTQTTIPYNNGTHTTHTVSPGNGSRPAPYVGTTTSDPEPNRQRSTTAPTAGVVVPF